MRLVWLTDIHLNFVDAQRLREFLESIRQQADAVAISGDIAESPGVVHYLKTMEEVLQKPIYFVLGNDDFYRSSIAKTRLQVAECETIQVPPLPHDTGRCRTDPSDRHNRARWLGGWPTG